MPLGSNFFVRRCRRLDTLAWFTPSVCAISTCVIPASMALLGEKAWWIPRWLDKVLPDLDVEGDRLIARLEQDSPAGRPAPAEPARVD